MEIEIQPEVLAELVELARAIAQNCQHPVLIAGLQPAEDYQVHGRTQPGLLSKRLAEIAELREAAGKSRIWQLSELADILYYSACLDVVRGGQSYWWSVDCFLLAHTYGFGQEEVEAAALAKYRLRAAKPYRKERETPEERAERDGRENAAIQAALDALPWPGVPVGELAARYGIPEITLRTADIPRRRAGKVILVNEHDPRFAAWLARYQRKKHTRRKNPLVEASGERRSAERG